jgi:hypothetical protein
MNRGVDCCRERIADSSPSGRVAFVTRTGCSALALGLEVAGIGRDGTQSASLTRPSQVVHCDPGDVVRSSRPFVVGERGRRASPSAFPIEASGHLGITSRGRYRQAT